MYDLKRKFLKDRWKYIAVTNTLIIIIGAFYIIQLRETIQAATYGFNQADWSGGADTGAVALHDNDQDEYNKYYSKDDNINTSTNGEISLFIASTTVTESNTSDFNNGTVDIGIVMSDNEEIKMGCPSGFELLNNNDKLYCRSNSCMTSTECTETVNSKFFVGSVINIDCDTMQALRTIDCSYPYSNYQAIRATNNGVGRGKFTWTGNYSANFCGDYNQASTQCIIGLGN